MTNINIKNNYRVGALIVNGNVKRNRLFLRKPAIIGLLFGVPRFQLNDIELVAETNEVGGSK